MKGSNSNSKAGKQKKILTKLNNTPFAKTNPKSLPIVKLIKTSASNPTMVVTELLVIDLKD